MTNPSEYWFFSSHIHFFYWKIKIEHTDTLRASLLASVWLEFILLFKLYLGWLTEIGIFTDETWNKMPNPSILSIEPAGSKRKTNLVWAIKWACFYDETFLLSFDLAAILTIIQRFTNKIIWLDLFFKWVWSLKFYPKLFNNTWSSEKILRHMHRMAFNLFYMNSILV